MTAQGNAEHRARLDAAFAAGGIEQMRSLWLAPHRPTHAWVRGRGWTLPANAVPDEAGA